MSGDEAMIVRYSNEIAALKQTLQQRDMYPQVL